MSVEHLTWFAQATIGIALSFVLCAACGGRTDRHRPAPSTSPDAGNIGMDSGTTDMVCGRRQDCDPGAECILNRCVSEPRECRQSTLRCNEPAPTCPPGQVPALEDGCWSECVDLGVCSYLDACELCVAMNQLCVKLDFELQDAFACKPRPAQCDPVSCDCLGSDFCGLRSCYAVEGDTVTCIPLSE
jgi:hypothetical protein